MRKLISAKRRREMIHGFAKTVEDAAKTSAVPSAETKPTPKLDADRRSEERKADDLAKGYRYCVKCQTTVKSRKAVVCWNCKESIKPLAALVEGGQ